MPKPPLTFFTELNNEELTWLFDQDHVVDDLKTLDASISLGILDLSEERARVVNKLNKAGIPLIAWLLLPEDQGYWFNLDNHEAAAQRYLDFVDWTEKNDLQWVGIGLDIEPDIQEMRQIMEKKQADKLVSTLFKRYLDKQRVAKARAAYQSLVERIHADGYPVESYHIPLISEERRAKSSVLQRTMGLIDLETDREVFMLYSSFFRPNGDALLWSYAPETDSIGVGNTGGGVDIEGVIDLPPLTWDEFSRDLRLCVRQGKPIHIFCLEGCVGQLFLSKLKTFDWDEPLEKPKKLRRVMGLRTGITTGLWLLERPWVILIALASLIGLGFLFKRSRDK